MIKNWYNNEIKAGEVFHFKNSLIPFIYVESKDCFSNGIFIDLNANLSYTFLELNIAGFSFYTKKDDDKFLGVEIDGKIQWVD